MISNLFSGKSVLTTQNHPDMNWRSPTTRRRFSGDCSRGLPSRSWSLDGTAAHATQLRHTAFGGFLASNLVAGGTMPF